MGKVLLSALPPRELDARLDGRELTGMTPDSITDEEELRTVLASVRAGSRGGAP